MVQARRPWFQTPFQTRPNHEEEINSNASDLIIDGEGMGNGIVSDEDDQEDVEDLLYGAQMDLIGHSFSSALIKLRLAVDLNSSAACTTLARLLYKGVQSEEGMLVESNTSSPPLPTQSTSYINSSKLSIRPSTSEFKRDRQEAAKLFLRGLEIELAKPLESSSLEGVDNKADGGRTLSRNTSRDSSSSRLGTYGSASEDESSAEGEFFNLERCLDLTVGLCDCFRFGVLKSHSFLASEDPNNLWKRGGVMAKKALAALSTIEPLSNPSSSTSIALPVPLLRSISKTRGESSTIDSTISRAASPRRATPSRSYTHPSTSMPPIASFVPSSFQSASTHHLPPDLKLRLTIQVHLCYILGLQSWPEEKTIALKYWNEIVRLANSTGGSVGNKEGDEIVQSAIQRLKVAKGEGVEEMMSSKQRKKREGSITSPILLEEVSSVDALEDIWREKLEGLALAKSLKEMKKSNGWKGKGKGKEEEEAGTPTRNPISFKAFGNFTSPLPRSIVETPPTINSPLVPTNSVKIAKFHFATASDYPSPPETPQPSPPASRNNSDLSAAAVETNQFNVDFTAATATALPITLAHLVKSSHQDSSNSTSIEPPSFPKAKRRSSNSSFRPPQLLPRVSSSASISTLPPDFFSTRSRGSITGSNWQSSIRATTSPGVDSFVSSPMSRMSSVTQVIEEEESTGRGSWIKSRFNVLKKSNLNPFKLQEKKITASSILNHVLKRDEESAGPGMYWAEEGEGEEDAEEIVEGDDTSMVDRMEEEAGERLRQQESKKKSSSRPSRNFSAPTRLSNGTRTPPKILVSQRSFIDVTSPHPSAIYPPKMTYTPPTPRDQLELFPAPNNDSSLSSSPRLSLSTSPSQPPFGSSSRMKVKRFDSGIDPMLLELERASRVGVRTKCFSCHKKGLNYPANRDGKTFCSRNCRLEGKVLV